MAHAEVGSSDEFDRNFEMTRRQTHLIAPMMVPKSDFHYTAHHLRLVSGLHSRKHYAADSVGAQSVLPPDTFSGSQIALTVGYKRLFDFPELWQKGLKNPSALGRNLVLGFQASVLDIGCNKHLPGLVEAPYTLLVQRSRTQGDWWEQNKR